METLTAPLEPSLAPCICGRPRKQHHRKLCGSCAMFKSRYGLTWVEVMEKRATAGHLCKVCDRLCRKNPIVFNGHRVCSHCIKLLLHMSNPQKRGRIDLVLNQTAM